jgi:hypothetical protein
MYRWIFNISHFFEANNQEEACCHSSNRERKLAITFLIAKATLRLDLDAWHLEIPFLHNLFHSCSMIMRFHHRIYFIDI